MVRIKRIPVQTVELFNPDNESLGFVNEYELNDVKIQIAEQELEGYYIIFDDTKIVIDKKGQLLKYPKGLFDMTMLQFSNLMDVRLKKLKNV